MRAAFSIRVGLVLSLLVLAIAGGAQAQESKSCTYDTCALRLTFSDFGNRKIVAGDAATPADGRGAWARRVPVLEAGSDSVRFHYVEYRSHAKRGGLFSIAGAVDVAVGLSLNYDDNKAWVIGLVSAGIIMEAIGAVNRSRSEDHLQRAIWLYNRDLPRQ